jgi:hypothetical protein
VKEGVADPVIGVPPIAGEPLFVRHPPHHGHGLTPALELFAIQLRLQGCLDIDLGRHAGPLLGQGLPDPAVGFLQGYVEVPLPSISILFSHQTSVLPVVYEKTQE